MLDLILSRIEPKIKLNTTAYRLVRSNNKLQLQHWISYKPPISYCLIVLQLFMIWNRFGTKLSGRKFVCVIRRHPKHTKLSNVNGIWNNLTEQNFRAIILCVSDDYDLVLQLSPRIRWWIRWFLCRLKWPVW